MNFNILNSPFSLITGWLLKVLLNHSQQLMRMPL